MKLKSRILAGIAFLVACPLVSAEDRTFLINVKNSKITFATGKIFGGKDIEVNGSFQNFDGIIQLDNNNFPLKSSTGNPGTVGVIEVQSVCTGELKDGKCNRGLIGGRRDRSIKADILGPSPIKMKFESLNKDPIQADSKIEVDVNVNLTIKDKSQPITLKGTIEKLSESKVGVKLSGTFNHKELFGIEYELPLIGLKIKENTTINLDLVAELCDPGTLEVFPIVDNKIKPSTCQLVP